MLIAGRFDKSAVFGGAVLGVDVVTEMSVILKFLIHNGGNKHGQRSWRRFSVRNAPCLATISWMRSTCCWPAPLGSASSGMTICSLSGLGSSSELTPEAGGFRWKWGLLAAGPDG